MLSIAVYLTLASTISQVFGSPLSASHRSQNFERRTLFNCSDIHSVFDSSCWEALHIAKYLSDPVAGWKSTPTCGPADDGSNCCNAHEPWTICFLRLATGITGTDCTLIGQPVSACTFSTSVYPNLSRSIRNQVHYIVYAIVAVNRFFDSMATTANAARYLYYNNLELQQQLWNLLGHKQEPLPTFDGLNVAYSVGAPFLASLPALETPDPLDTTSYNASTQFTRSLHAAPSVAQAIWPLTGNGLDNSTQIFQRGVSLLMSDVPSFAAFCSTGAFTSGNPPRFDSSSAAVPFAGAANVYMASSMLQFDGWYAVPAGIASAASVKADRGCTVSVGGGWLCRGSGGRVRYHSAITSRSYDLKYQGINLAQINGADLLSQIDNGRAISIGALFDGAYNCTFEGAAGTLLGVGADGSIDTSCMSVLPMYLPKGSACPPGATEVRGECPFGLEE